MDLIVPHDAKILQPSQPSQPLGARNVLIPQTATAAQYLELMNRKHAVVMEGGKTVVIKFVGENEIEFSNRRDLESFYANIWVQEGDTREALGRWWWLHRNRRQYEEIVFDPRGNTPPEVYNRWRGLAVEPKRGKWDLYANNLKENMCHGNPLHYNYLLDWMAHAVQKPEEKPGVAVVLRSDERGTGKSTTCKYFAELFGPHGLEVAAAEHATGKFNGHLEMLVVLVINEAIWAGDHAAESVLKSLITEPSITIENKFRAVKQQPSYLRVMMTANSSWVVPAGWSERRFFVLEASSRGLGNPLYWTLLAKQMREGGLAAFLYDLLERDISTFNPREVPVTEALVDQKIQSLDDTTRWLLSCLERGTWSEKHGTWQTEIGRNELYELYLESGAKLGGKRTRAMQTELGRLLTRVFPGCVDGPRIRLAGSRVRHYLFPPLEQARAEFARYLQAPETANLFGYVESDDNAVEMLAPNPQPPGSLVQVDFSSGLIVTPSD